MVYFKDWYKLIGGIGFLMFYNMELIVVDEMLLCNGVGFGVGGKGVGEGVQVVVLWMSVDEYGNGWINSVLGGVDEIEVMIFVKFREEYKDFVKFGSQWILTIVFNNMYVLYKGYILV